jgi:phenylalanyl-tRNA synthetase beta subunit
VASVSGEIAISAAEKKQEYQFISSHDPGEISVMNHMTKDNDMMNVGQHSGFTRAMKSVKYQTAYTKPLIIRNISQTV